MQIGINREVSQIYCSKIFLHLLSYYYSKILECGVTNYSLEEYENDFKNAVCYFPFFVAIWFGTLDEDDLIDKNFPYFFINFYHLSMFFKLDLI